MFHPMRRAAQALSEDECWAVLARNAEGVLAVSGDDGYPYAVPLNYFTAEGKIIFHCAKEGHKIDAIRRSDKVSFAVIDERRIVPEEYSTAYRSVIAFGRARILTDKEEIIRALDALAARFTEALPEDRMKTVMAGLSGAAVIVIDVEHITGKEGRLLANARHKE